jgi:hypothetical protein
MAVDPRWRENQEVFAAAAGSANELIPALARIVGTGNWREFVHPMRGLLTFETFGAYCSEFLMLSAETVYTLLERSQYPTHAETVRRLLREEVQPVDQHGAIGNGRSRGCNTKSTLQTDATYVIARLKRDDPQLAADVIAGNISPHAAARQAGIRKPRCQVRTDDARLAINALLRFYTREQLLAALAMP